MGEYPSIFVGPITIFVVPRDDDSLPAGLVGEMASLVVPGAGSGITRMFNAVQAEWDRNRSRALKAAEITAGLSREDLAERIEHHPELVPLVTRLLWEAAMTGQSEVLEAMGAAFGAAVEEPAKASQYELILGGLRNLLSEDVRLLRLMRDRPVARLSSDENAEEWPAEFLTTGQLGDDLGSSAELVEFSLVRLTSQGFASSMSVMGGTRFDVTELGRILYDALERLTDLS